MTAGSHHNCNSLQEAPRRLVSSCTETPGRGNPIKELLSIEEN